MNTSSSPVWLITGCSSGFGRALVERVLARGWRVVATARDAAAITGLAGGTADSVLTLPLDVTRHDQVEAAVQAAMARFGRIDVLVNNAGYGYQSSVEEGVDAEIRAQFEANVFGLFDLTRMVLPHMRNARSGHILNISSVAGFVGFPGSGYYAATKHAVEGWSDALASEVEPLGIKVTCVEPGPFRTDWAGRSLKQTQSRLADYAETAGARLRNTAEKSGTQAGDPVRASDAMIALTLESKPPRHLVLGAWGVEAVEAKLRATLAEIDAWRATSVATDFPAEDA